MDGKAPCVVLIVNILIYGYLAPLFLLAFVPVFEDYYWRVLRLTVIAVYAPGAWAAWNLQTKDGIVLQYWLLAILFWPGAIAQYLDARGTW